jgi:hypothetical protein
MRAVLVLADLMVDMGSTGCRIGILRNFVSAGTFTPCDDPYRVSGNMHQGGGREAVACNLSRDSVDVLHGGG